MRDYLSKAVIAFYHFKRRHPRFVMAVLIFVIIPIVSGLALGYEMKADVAATIPTVIVDHDNSEFSRKYSSFIEESQYFEVIEYANNDNRIKELMDANKAYAGVIIPANFYNDMKEGKAPKLLTVYDGSMLAVIASSKTAMSEILISTKMAYMMSIFEGKLSVVPEQVMHHVMPISVTYRNLYNPTKSFRNYILPGMLAAIIQVGIAMQGAERGYENQQRKKSFLEQLKIIFGWSVMSAVSIILCLGVQYAFFKMSYKGTLLGGVLLTCIFAFCIFSAGYIIGNIIPDRTFAIQLSAVLVLPTTILGGYTFPVLGMPMAYQSIAKAIPFYYYGNGIRDLCLKGLELHHLVSQFKFFSIFIAIELLIILAITVLKRKGLQGNQNLKYEVTYNEE